jgi:serine/threonine protein kinase
MTSPSAPDLSKLADTYDILTELSTDGDGRSVTYLGRHRELGRDVAITVVSVPGGGANNTLTHFASDARLLSTMRHANVAPVIEGRWLGDDAFAVVRARVRGTTLDQVLVAVGTFPLPRVAETLAQVHSALDWARTNGVVHRHVAPENVWFQQGSGRVLLAVGWSELAVDSLPDACTDARTIGELARTMLTGQVGHGESDTSLAELRPDLPPAIVEETEALLRCRAGGMPRDIAEFLTLLASTPLAETAVTEAREAETAPMAPAVPPVPAVPVSAAEPVVVAAMPKPATPVGRDETVVIAPPSRSIGPRVAAAVAVAALALIIVAIIVHRRGSDNRVAVTTRADTAAGEVAPRSDTSPLTNGMANLPAPPVAPYPSIAPLYPTPGVPTTPVPVPTTPATPTPMPTDPTTGIPGYVPPGTITRAAPRQRMAPPSTVIPPVNEPPVRDSARVDTPVKPDTAAKKPDTLVKRDSVKRDTILKRDTLPKRDTIGRRDTLPRPRPDTPLVRPRPDTPYVTAKPRNKT